MIIKNIKWDTDGEIVRLPNKIKVPKALEEELQGKGEVETEEIINDYLSESYGWCVLSWMLN